MTDPCRLYLVSPPALDIPHFAGTFEAALDGGDVASFQLRLKDADDDTIAAAVACLMPIAHAHDVAFLVNDRPDLAATLACDGAHVGQEDMSMGQARAHLGPDAIIGVTCHASRHLAMEAADAGADYVAFGAFFPTVTKEAKTRAEPEILRWWHELIEVPCVAIGGITVDNAKELTTAGADFIAVSAGVWAYPQGPGAAVTALNTVLSETAVASPKGN
ncbi:MAG: thiamine phosphate synthase [Alphaproteobacteria bacterium]|nr:thiamine phosphate synthase [Alphaproteobacteria bacterium]